LIVALDDKPLDAITEEDLQHLVRERVAERKRIEYKESLPGGSTDEKREFLYDVSSLANAVGGHLVFGMKEDAGVATEVCGLETADRDRDISRLEKHRTGWS
jgi:predicted HTH transcriptional regulator